MASPLYRTLGFDLKEIATVTKLYGVWVGIAGGFVGGWALAASACSRPCCWAPSWRRPRTSPSRGSRPARGDLAPDRGDLRRELLRLLRRHRAHRLHVEPHEPGLRGPRNTPCSPRSTPCRGSSSPARRVFIVTGIGYPAFFTFTSLIGLPVLPCALPSGGGRRSKSRRRGTPERLPASFPRGRLKRRESEGHSFERWCHDERRCDPLRGDPSPRRYGGSGLSEDDLAALRRAVQSLEQPGLAARLSAAAGTPSR